MRFKVSPARLQMFTPPPPDEMHPTHPSQTSRYCMHRNVCGIVRLQRGECFTDWKGAYAYASQAVLAL